MRGGAENNGAERKRQLFTGLRRATCHGSKKVKDPHSQPFCVFLSSEIGSEGVSAEQKCENGPFSRAALWTVSDQNTSNFGQKFVQI